MSIAEVFLMLWAVLATVLAVVLQSLLKRAVIHGKAISFLLAEVATGEVKAKDAGNGFISVENEDLRMTFKRVGGSNE
jgi:hypothetical protein